MDILFEVGRTPTPPKPPVNASPRPSAERQDAAHSQDRTDAYDRRKPPEQRETRGRDERSGEVDSRRADDPGRTDRKGAAEETDARQPDNSAEADDAATSEDSFSSHMAAKQNAAKKPPADNQAKVIELTKPSATPADSITDKVVVKPGAAEAEAVAASPAYPATDHTKAVIVASAAEAKPVAAAPAIVKAEPPKTGDVKTKSALITTAPAAARSATAAATAADGSRAAGFALPQDLQGGAFPVDGSPLDIDAEVKPQLGERIDVRPAGAAPQKTALPTFNRLLAGEMAPPVIPQGEVMIDAGLGADASPDLAALKQITATAHASQLSAVGAASQAAQAQAPAASQLVAAVKAERVGNGNTIEVRLDPPEMGRVRIDFSLETADAVKAVVTVERSETLEHLRRNVNDLMDQLKQAGFTSVDLEFSNQGSSAFEQDDAAAFADIDGDAPLAQSDVVYLSLRDDAQMDLLV